MAAVFTATYTTTGMCMCMRTSRHALFFDAFSIHKLNDFLIAFDREPRKGFRFIFWRDFYAEKIYGSSQSQLQIRTNVPMLT